MLRVEQMALLAKIETAYGTDAVPTGAANCMIVTDVTFPEIDGVEIERKLVVPFHGHLGALVGPAWRKMAFATELTGHGTAGSPPFWAVLARAAGLSQILVAGTSATYAPISVGHEAVSLHWYLDGTHRSLLGTRGTGVLSLGVEKIPEIRWTMTGLVGGIDDVALPTLTLPSGPKPLIPSKMNTPTVSLHNYSGVMEDFELDIGNMISPRLKVGDETIEISGRKAIGSITLEGDAVAGVDWESKWQSRSRGALALTHGATAGNIVQIAASNVEIGKPVYGRSKEGMLTVKLPLMFVATGNSGGNDFSIVVK